MTEVRGKRIEGSGRRILFLFVFIFFPLSSILLPLSYAQDSSFRVKTRAWPTRVTVGDLLRLHIEVERPGGYSFVPLSRELSLDPFEIKDMRAMSNQRRPGISYDVFTLTLTVFEWGSLSIPPVAIDYKDAAGRVHRAHSQPVAIQVISLGRRPTDKDDIRPIKGPVSLGTGTARALALLFLAMLLAAGLTVKVILRRRKQAINPEALLPPHERAYRELERLKGRDYPGEGMIKEYYSELADILRRYLERRFEVETLEMTTREITGQLDEKRLGEGLAGKITQLLENSDLVKFAKYVPPPSLAEDMERLLLVIVNLTKPAGEEVVKN